MRIDIIFSDLDGTLLLGDKGLSPGTAEALARAAERRQVYARFSTLNQMLNVRGWDRERRAIINYIRAHRSDILKDARAPRRDKLAIGLLSIGYPVYCACWRAHQRRIAGRNP